MAPRDIRQIARKNEPQVIPCTLLAIQVSPQVLSNFFSHVVLVSTSLPYTASTRTSQTPTRAFVVARLRTPSNSYNGLTSSDYRWDCDRKVRLAVQRRKGIIDFFLVPASATHPIYLSFDRPTPRGVPNQSPASERFVIASHRVSRN